MKEVLTVIGVGIAIATLMFSFQSQTQSQISALQSQMESQFATAHGILDRLDDRGYELNERLSRIESQFTN